MSKVVLITGASSGIGKSIAEFLYYKGFKVYGTSRHTNSSLDFIFPLIPLDVRNVESIKNAVNHVITSSKRLDIVINNAGVGITGPLEELPMAEIKNHFDTNFFGAIAVIQAVLPQMRKQNSGLIINITSIAGYMGLPYRSIYSASKGALELITEAIRMEVKNFGVKITNVAPGDFATNIVAGRFHAPIIINSVYEVPYNRVLKSINLGVRFGKNPNEMNRIIHKIILTKNPKIHYKVGAFKQKFSIFLKRILPDSLFERLLIKHYGLRK